jgi:hypothetical protein
MNAVGIALDRAGLAPAERNPWRSFADRPEIWAPFVSAWLDRGFRLPPRGAAEDDPNTSLRSRLYEIADARPRDLGRWVGEATGTTPHQVVSHVFREWRELKVEAGVDPRPEPEPDEADRRAAAGSLARVASVLRSDADDWTTSDGLSSASATSRTCVRPTPRSTRPGGRASATREGL